MNKEAIDSGRTAVTRIKTLMTAWRRAAADASSEVTNNISYWGDGT